MATIRDIAAAAGVSIGAVSRILNNDTTLSVTAATRQHVLAVAAGLGYTKKPRKEKAQSELTVGILQWFSPAQELEDPYYLSVRLGVENYCIEHHLNVVRSFRSDADYRNDLSGVNALVCIGKFHETEIRAFSEITNRLILVDMHTNRASYNSISLDFETALYEVMNDFHRKGFCHVGYLGGLEYLNASSVYPDKRRELFLQYAAQMEMVVEPYLKEDAFSSESGYHLMHTLIGEGRVPQAIFAASDTIAMGAMRALTEAGFCIPGDISVVGFDDISAAAYTAPPLTTIHAPAFEMGSYAVQFLHIGFPLYEKLKTPLHITLPCYLVRRDSLA